MADQVKYSNGKATGQLIINNQLYSPINIAIKLHTCTYNKATIQRTAVKPIKHKIALCYADE